MLVKHLPLFSTHVGKLKSVATGGPATGAMGNALHGLAICRLLIHIKYPFV
jgi:hypothetical protein